MYEADDFPFVAPKPLTEEAARAEAQKHFNQWFSSAEAFAASAAFLVQRGNFNEAAFNYHQATERLYHCVLLTLTLYSPKSHKLNFLRSQAEPLVPDLIAVWPRDTKFAQRCFELLRQAYVNARYSPHYQDHARRVGVARRARRTPAAFGQGSVREAARAARLIARRLRIRRPRSSCGADA